MRIIKNFLFSVNYIFLLKFDDKIFTVNQNDYIIFREFSLGDTLLSYNIDHSQYWEGSGLFYVYQTFGKDCVSPPKENSFFKKKSQHIIDVFSSLNIKNSKLFIEYGFAPVCLIIFCSNGFNSCKLKISLEIFAGISLIESEEILPQFSKSFEVKGTGFNEENLKSGVFCRIKNNKIPCKVMQIFNSGKMKIFVPDGLNFTGNLYFSIRGKNWPETKMGNIKLFKPSENVKKKTYNFLFYIILIYFSMNILRSIVNRNRYENFKNKFLKR